MDPIIHQPLAGMPKLTLSVPSNLTVFLRLGYCFVLVWVSMGTRGHGAAARAQGTEEQFRRIAELDQLTAAGVLNEAIVLQWFGPEDRYAWYESQRADSAPERRVVDTQTGEIIPAAEFAAYLAEFGTLRAEAGQGEAESDLPALRRVEASGGAGPSSEIRIENRTPGVVKLLWHASADERVPYGEIAPGESRRQHTYAGHTWLLVDTQGQPLAAFRAQASPGRFVLNAETPKPSDSPRRRRRDSAGTAGSAPPQSVSPNGDFRVELRDHNVVLIAIPEPPGDEATPAGSATEPPREWVLTTDGTENDPYREPIWWAPDGKHFCLFRIAAGERRQVTLVESAPRDQLQPKTIEFDYAKPGDRLDHPRLHLFGIDRSTHHVVDSAQAPNPYSIDEVSWHADGQSVRMLYNERGHQRLAVLAIDVASGQTRAMIDERSPTFIDYAHKRYLRLLDETDEAIWMSERSGWNHLYLIRQSTGEVIRPLTSGDYVVREVVDFDAKNRTLLVAVGGFYPEQDPYQVHLLRVSLDGAPPLPLTESDGNHTWEISPSGKHLVARYSRVDLAPVTEIRSLITGQLICVVERADATELNRIVGHPPRRFVAKGRDGETDIHGIIVFPYDFEPDGDRRYPVLELIYAGPHSAHVPKSFGRLLDMRKTADLGFIVVRIDGMGTSHRSKAFHDVCWKNLADSGFPDRIAWMRAAAAEIPQMDLSRVGIWGGSAGGQSALRALIDHGDFYKAAFADCGCHDNRMDKIWWNELWMGWPVGPHYEQQSNVTGAHRLTGALMLAVGELDRNVDPASTLQVVDALVRADKDFDLLLIPGAGHGAGGRPYGERRRKDFFIRHFWGNRPTSVAPEPDRSR